MRNIDFSSWQGVLLTLSGLALVTLIGVGIRLLMMFTVQGRRERLCRASVLAGAGAAPRRPRRAHCIVAADSDGDHSSQRSPGRGL